MEYGPLVMVGISERVVPGTAAVQSIILNFKEDSIMLMNLGDGYLEISADSDVAYQVFSEVQPLIRNLNP
jgi:hypothetical protein